MKAARLYGHGQPLQIDDIPTPVPGPGQVIVAVRGAGFCHSDIHVIDGEIPILPKMPVVVIALAESGRLTAIPIEVASLDRINDVYRRLKQGEIVGRAVIAPAA
jgi:D-arabinose 1-dehydrogenase-like Zn-dependent alcohol dehydrogenase